MRISTWLFALIVLNFTASADEPAQEFNKQENLTPNEMREEMKQELIEQIDVIGKNTSCFL